MENPAYQASATMLSLVSGLMSADGSARARMASLRVRISAALEVPPRSTYRTTPS
jgi:hypothetical protein